MQSFRSLISLASLLLIITVSAASQTYTVLFNPQTGQHPSGELVLDKAGNIYGTMSDDSNFTSGKLFQIVRREGRVFLIRTYGFSQPSEGLLPEGSIAEFNGKVYGTTFLGGSGCPTTTNGCGVVYELSLSAGGFHEAVLHNLDGFDGAAPNGVVRDPSGNLYGVANGGAEGYGAVFEVANGQGSAIHVFTGNPDGAYPYGTLLFDNRSGNIYGTTQYGGLYDQGTIFELSSNGDGTWSESILYSFRGASDGGQPYSGVVIDSYGSLYGAATVGGLAVKACYTAFGPGCGVIFKLRKNTDGTWSQRVLHRFSGPPLDGVAPVGNLVRDPHGNIFGVTFQGGTNNLGTLFEVEPSGNELLLHSFGTGFDGQLPSAGLVRDSFRNLYGTTQKGGSPACPSGCGIVFELTPPEQ